MRVIIWGLPLLCLTATASAASIAGSRVSADRLTPLLEERSDQGLRAANRAFQSAKNAWRCGDAIAFVSSINQIDVSVELAYQALVAVRATPRERPAYFKRAEIALERLQRRLQFFHEQVCYDDRPIVERIAHKVSMLHDELLTGLTSGTPLSGFGEPNALN